MRFVPSPDTMSDHVHMMFVSRHVYVLANGLVHLAPCAYVRPLETRAQRSAQWTGSALLGSSGLLLVTAFVVETIGQRPRTIASTYGLHLLPSGVLLHVVPAWWSERRSGCGPDRGARHEGRRNPRDVAVDSARVRRFRRDPTSREGFGSID
jgi:hypothetical protein